MNNLFITPVTNISKGQKVNQPVITPAEAHKSFSTFLKDSIEKVNEAQIKSDTVTEKLVSGKNVDLHEVMVASQKASITLQLTLEIRNKAIEAYQEMMRMQV